MAENPTTFRVLQANGEKLTARPRSIYTVAEAAPYRMDHDLDALPIPVW